MSQASPLQKGRHWHLHLLSKDPLRQVLGQLLNLGVRYPNSRMSICSKKRVSEWPDSWMRTRRNGERKRRQASPFLHRVPLPRCVARLLAKCQSATQWRACERQSRSASAQHSTEERVEKRERGRRRRRRLSPSPSSLSSFSSSSASYNVRGKGVAVCGCHRSAVRPQRASERPRGQRAAAAAAGAPGESARRRHMYKERSPRCTKTVGVPAAQLGGGADPWRPRESSRGPTRSCGTTTRGCSSTRCAARDAARAAEGEGEGERNAGVVMPVSLSLSLSLSPYLLRGAVMFVLA